MKISNFISTIQVLFDQYMDIQNKIDDQISEESNEFRAEELHQEFIKYTARNEALIELLSLTLSISFEHAEKILFDSYNKKYQ